MRVTVEALTPRRWKDLEALFGAKGACAGCWCMFWRLGPGERFEDVKGAKAKRRFKALVTSGRAEGYLAYVAGVPVGWLSSGRRRDFPKLDRAPSLTCADAERVWSLPCFFVRSDARGQGVATALLDRAVRDARQRRREVLEAYPVKPARPGEAIPAAFAWTGTVPLFRQAGFRVVQPKEAGKQRMRLELEAPGPLRARASSAGGAAAPGGSGRRRGSGRAGRRRR